MAATPPSSLPPQSLPILPSTPPPNSASPSLSPKPEPLPLSGPMSKLSSLRKSPPFPWQHQETLALIQAYQEKWYSLKKGQLKASQWEEVAAAVTALCGLSEPSRTSTQCRHKIEKLRKRYRSELRKPYPNSWQYFGYMDSLERGPLPLNARPISVVNTSSNNANGSLYSGFSGHRDSIRSDAVTSDESDEEWNTNYGMQAAKKHKSRSVNNVVRGDVPSGIRSAKRMETGAFPGWNVAGMSRNTVNGKKKRFCDGDASDEDEDDDDMDHEEMLIEEVDEGGERLAKEIRGFAEMFMRMENKKMEMVREMEKYRMEMEKKRIEMILETQSKIIDTIGRTFGAQKRAKLDQDS